MNMYDGDGSNKPLRILIERTDETLELSGVAVRRWAGTIEGSGAPVDVFVHMMAASDEVARAELEAQGHKPQPEPEVSITPDELRKVLEALAGAIGAAEPESPESPESPEPDASPGLPDPQALRSALAAVLGAANAYVAEHKIDVETVYLHSGLLMLASLYHRNAKVWNWESTLSLATGFDSALRYVQGVDAHVPKP